MNRRDFCKNAVRTTAVASVSATISQLYSTPLFAQASSDYKALVCVFLSGGVDSSNLVFPVDKRYASYIASRPDVGVRQADGLELVTTGSSSYAMHPALAETAKRFNSGQVAILANAGTLARPVSKANIADESLLPAGLFSHATQIGEWQTSVAATAVTTGWAGRVADVLLGSSSVQKRMPAAISLNGYQLLGQGAQTMQATASSGYDTTSLLNTFARLNNYFAMSEQAGAYNEIQRYTKAVQTNSRSSISIISDAIKAGSSMKTTFPTSSIGQQLQAVAQLINGRGSHDTNRQIFMCVDGSYDSHAYQANYTGDRLYPLDAALAAFSAAMAEIGMNDSVVLFTASDFGRSLSQNQNSGTDHGWGGHQFIMGGPVKGGQMFGTFPDLTLGGADDFNTIGIWIPTTSTSQYAATLASWLGVPSSSLPMIFPELANFSTRILTFV